MAPVTLVCAAEARRLPGLVAEGLSIGLQPPAARPRGGGPPVAIAAGRQPDLALPLDLAFADARAVLGSIAAFEGLDLVWVRAEDARVVRADLVSLTPQTAEHLRLEVARQGEWRLEDPPPAGFSRRAWRREARRPGGARLARGDLPRAPVVVVAPVGAGSSRGKPADCDIELRFPGGPPIPEAGASIHLGLDSPAQRALAGVAAAQESVIILLVDDVGGWLAQVELALDADSHALIRDAAELCHARAGAR